jgi:hypothetical protein
MQPWTLRRPEHQHPRWPREKLAFLQEEEAKAADPAQKFQLRKQIEEAQAKILNLGGRP